MINTHSIGLSVKDANIKQFARRFKHYLLNLCMVRIHWAIEPDIARRKIYAR